MSQKLVDFFEKTFYQEKVALIILKFYLGSRIDPLNLWPEPFHGLTPELSFKTIIITFFIHTWTRVNPSWPMTWALPRSTHKLSFKIMIITIFMLTLTQVDPPDMRSRPYPRLTLESYNNNFYFMLNQVNQVDPFDTWPKFYPWVDLESSFQTMVISLLSLCRPGSIVNLTRGQSFASNWSSNRVLKLR